MHSYRIVCGWLWMHMCRDKLWICSKYSSQALFPPDIHAQYNNHLHVISQVYMYHVFLYYGCLHVPREPAENIMLSRLQCKKKHFMNVWPQFALHVFHRLPPEYIGTQFECTKLDRNWAWRVVHLHWWITSDKRDSWLDYPYISY